MHEAPTLLDPDDLLHMPDGESYELIDGRPVEKPMGAKSDAISVILAAALYQFVDANGLGHVFGGQTGYRCFDGRSKLVRKPDVSFVARGRLPDDEKPDGDILIPPDLAVESVSPNDSAEEVEIKIQDFLAVGVRLVWIIYPLAKTVVVRRPTKSDSTRAGADVLDGEDVLPGFSFPVHKLFV